MSQEFYFWCCAIGMLVLALVAVLIPVRERTLSSADQRAQENRVLLAEQLKLLDEERVCGLISEVSYAQSLEDIERRALEEAQGKFQSQTSKRLPLRYERMALGCAALFFIVASVALYARLGSAPLINLIDAGAKGGIMQSDGSLSEVKPGYSLASLEAYIARRPEDERALVLTARRYVEEQRPQDALRCYRQAFALNRMVSRDPDVMLEFAATLMQVRALDEAVGLLKKALIENPQNLRMHELMAIASLETQSWHDARVHLEVLLESVNPSDPVYESIAQTAAQAARLERESARKASAPR